jgi:hypothetical protein
MSLYIILIDICDIKKWRKHVQSFMAFSDSVGPPKVTGVVTAYSSTTARKELC